jgi:hypothetical protein
MSGEEEIPMDEVINEFVQELWSEYDKDGSGHLDK